MPPPVVLRRFGRSAPRILVVGASTGGPQALAALLAALAPDLARVPVVVVLHIPDGFHTVLDAFLARETGLPVHIAGERTMLRDGHVYLAGHGAHAAVARCGGDLALVRARSPAENFCRPAVDVLFRSAAAACGAAVLGIVLTGMGTDGLAGARKIIEAGGSIVAQDEVTSVVWGMPGAVARDGLCAAVAPVETLAAIVAYRLRAGLPLVRP